MSSDIPITQQSLGELFDRDPLQLTDEDVDRMCAELKRLRKLWIKEEAEAKATRQVAQSRKVKLTTDQLLSMDLGDLQ